MLQKFFVIVLCIWCSSRTVLANVLIEVSKFDDGDYDPTWASLDSRPLPEWYDDAKIGIFLHWGVYSVPNLGTEWFWFNWRVEKKQDYVDYMAKHFPPGFTYQDFGKEFNAELFDPVYWAELFQDAGAKYVVLTSKHHDGFAMWPSKFSFSWNSMDLGAHRDLLGELAEAVRNRTNLKFGLYHSLYEWFHPLYLHDKAKSFKSADFVKTKLLPQMYELVHQYKPSVLWTDGDWEANDTYWKSTEFLTWLYNESPVKDEIVVNDRWGKGIPCAHGGFFTCQDRFDPGVLQPHKWENAMTIDKKSWGYRRDAKLEDYMTTKELIEKVVRTIACGGNILINVGPTKEGLIDVIFEERLRDLGAWLKVNGKAVYGSQPWLHQNDTLTEGVWFTTPKVENSAVVFAFILNWPKSDVIEIELLRKHMSASGSVRMLGLKNNLQWLSTEKTIKVLLPSKGRLSVDHCWVLAFTLK